jgi:hypothetical protein
MTISPHEVLQVSSTAGHEEVRRSYRRLAKRWHPDHCSADPTAAERFRALSDAYEAIRRVPIPSESLLWRATRGDESIVLTSRRLVHHVSGSSVEVALVDIAEVSMLAGRAALIVRTSTAVHCLDLPREQALRLAELLNDRAG